MKKLWIIPLGIGIFALNTYAGITFGIRGGYSYQNLKATEYTYTTPDTSYTETLEDTAKGFNGFGGELSLGFELAPLAIEVNAGYYTVSHSEEEEFDGFSGTWTYTVNSIKVSALGKFVVPGIPMVTPWIGVGPFVGLNTHKVKMEFAGITTTMDGEMVPNFGVLAGMGVDISLPGSPISFNVGALFDYFLVSKSKIKQEYWGDGTMTSEGKFNQWGVNVVAGVSFKI